MGSLVLCSCRLFLRLRYWYELCSASHSKGANDVANAFATSVGSGALSLRSAILIAAVMEFFGAFLLGGNVATTITKNITNAELYSDKPEVLMLDEPTRGIDVGAKNEIYKLMNRLAAEGKSIIMISSEMTEILRMSDRIVVMCEGRKTGELGIEEATQERIMHAATLRN